MDKAYYHLSRESFGQGARLPVRKLGDDGEVYYELALEMLRTIRENEEAGRHTVMICPVGPVGQYPIFTRLVNQTGLSLRRCWFINMDEYLTERDEWITKTHPLSFRGYMDAEVYGKIREELRMPENQRLFPDPQDLGAISALLERLGGADLCIGGIGINGHLAFNEPRPGMPPEEFAGLSVRVEEIAAETRAINAAGSLGGALGAMPRRCVTIGMREILGARKLRLACFRDWHRAVVREAAYGEISAAFPATLAQNHPDAELLVTRLVSEAAF